MWILGIIFLIFSKRGSPRGISEDRIIEIVYLESNWFLWCYVKSIIISKK